MERRRYTKQVLLRLKESPLVERPVDLPPLETWGPESRNKGEGNDAGRSKAVSRAGSSDGSGNGSEKANERSGPKPRSGLERNMVLGPPRMNFASSVKKPSDTAVPDGRAAVEEDARSLPARVANSGTHLGLPQLKSAREPEYQNDGGDRRDHFRANRIDLRDTGQHRDRHDDGGNRSRLGDANKGSFVSNRRRPDSNSFDGRSTSPRPYQGDRGRYSFEDDTPEWMNSTSTTNMSTSKTRTASAEKLEKFAMPADGMDDIAKFRAKMKERERARGDPRTNSNAKTDGNSSEAVVQRGMYDTAPNEFAAPVSSEVDHNAEVAALGRRDPSLALAESGADALLSKRLLSAASSGNGTSIGVDRTAPRFRRFFELEREQPISTNLTSSSTVSPSLAPPPVRPKTSNPSISNPIDMLSQRFPDAVISTANVSSNRPVVLSEADVLIRFSAGTSANGPPGAAFAIPPSTIQPPQPSSQADDFNRVMLMLSKQRDVVSPRPSPSVPAGYPVRLNHISVQPASSMSFAAPPTFNMVSTHSMNNHMPSNSMSAPSQRPPSSMNYVSPTFRGPPINSNLRPTSANTYHHQNSITTGGVVSSLGRPGGVYAQQAPQAGLAAMVQAGILAKQSSNSSIAAALGDTSDMRMSPSLLPSNRTTPPPGIDFGSNNTSRGSSFDLDNHMFLVQQPLPNSNDRNHLMQHYSYPMNVNIPILPHSSSSSSLLMEMMHQPPSRHSNAPQPPNGRPK
ncbi:hypothetical protein SeLEV6574_g02546, partial [Synchytrium endobioticum]